MPEKTKSNHHTALRRLWPMPEIVQPRFSQLWECLCECVYVCVCVSMYIKAALGI